MKTYYLIWGSESPPEALVNHLKVFYHDSIFWSTIYPSAHTYLADSGLQHRIQSPLGCVHVSRDALAFDDTRELAHVSRHAQNVVEAVGRPTANLIIAGGRQRWRQRVFNRNIQESSKKVPGSNVGQTMSTSNPQSKKQGRLGQLKTLNCPSM